MLGGMKALLTMLLGVIASASLVAAQSATAPPSFKSFVGYWRINVDVSDNKNVLPTLLLNIRVTDSAITIGRMAGAR